MNFASRQRAPITMTRDEQRSLLRVSGQHHDTFRDHVIFSTALGTGLRQHEIIALDCGDVRNDAGGIRMRFPLRVFKRSNKDEAMQEAILPDALRFKLEKYLRWKKSEREPVGDGDPLFLSQEGNRISARQLRWIFDKWQREASLERSFTFHSLRHTALTNLYEATKDIRIVKKIGRHKSIESTMIYVNASDDTVLRAARSLPC